MCVCVSTDTIIYFSKTQEKENIKMKSIKKENGKKKKERSFLKLRTWKKITVKNWKLFTCFELISKFHTFILFPTFSRDPNEFRNLNNSTKPKAMRVLINTRKSQSNSRTVIQSCGWEGIRTWWSWGASREAPPLSSDGLSRSASTGKPWKMSD